MINKYGKGSVLQISTVFCALTTLLLKGSSYTGIFRHLFHHVFRTRNFQNTAANYSVIFKIQQPWGWSFDWKCSEFNIPFKNAEANPENVFCFWDNGITIGCVKFCLLRREFLWWAVNVLRNSLRNLHITKRDFFQLNCLHSDQKIW